VPIRKCATCKAPVETPATGRRPKYCSDRCRVAAYRKGLSAKNVGALRTTETSDWYTPPDIIDKARRVLGGFDLDPASCAEANATGLRLLATLASFANYQVYACHHGNQRGGTANREAP
jgi:endogenous inhibitor of DNA gyrase (YacG/DUF329 family)